MTDGLAGEVAGHNDGPNPAFYAAVMTVFLGLTDDHRRGGKTHIGLYQLQEQEPVPKDGDRIGN